MITRFRYLALTAFASLAACGGGGGGDSTNPGGGGNKASKIEAVNAGPFSGTVGTTLAAFQVKVTDASGKPVANVPVTFAVTSGTATTSPTSATSDASGLAQTQVTLGTAATTYEVSASATGVAGVVRFTITATAGPVATVSVTPRVAKVYGIGDTVRFRATASDQFGNTIPSPSVTWASRDQSLFTIDASGLARTLKKGATAYVVGTASGKADSTTLEVPLTPCGTLVAANLAVGAVVTDIGATGACIGGAGGEFAVVATNHSTVGSSSASLAMLGNGLGAPPASASLTSTLLSAQPVPLFTPPILTRRDRSADLAFRAREQAALAPLIPGARAWYANRGRAATTAIIPGTAELGSVHTLNLDVGGTSCSSSRPRGVRVVAVTSSAIVVADTLNPANGFTDSDYQRYAAAFDTLVSVVDYANFGNPTDIDNNGRVVIVFTRMINELGGNVVGQTRQRDLFPTTNCSVSNAGELVYVWVPDPVGTAGGGVISKSLADAYAIVTIAHELQHLINYSRRLYVNNTPTETAWMHEGLSQMAEELIFFRATGFAQRANLKIDQMIADQAKYNLWASYQSGNLLNYDFYLLRSAQTSPYSEPLDDETYGAAWSFLRFAADQRGDTDGDIWMRLVNSGSNGHENLRSTFGKSVAEMAGLVRDWGVANYADDFVTGLAPRFAHRNWDERSFYAFYRFIFNDPSFRFPLESPAGMFENTQVPLTIRAGSSTVNRFTVGSGGEVFIRPINVPPGANVTLSVVRIK